MATAVGYPAHKMTSEQVSSHDRRRQISAPLYQQPANSGPSSNCDQAPGYHSRAQRSPQHAPRPAQPVYYNQAAVDNAYPAASRDYLQSSYGESGAYPARQRDVTLTGRRARDQVPVARTAVQQGPGYGHGANPGGGYYAYDNDISHEEEGELPADAYRRSQTTDSDLRRREFSNNDPLRRAFTIGPRDGYVRQPHTQAYNTAQDEYGTAEYADEYGTYQPTYGETYSNQQYDQGYEQPYNQEQSYGHQYNEPSYQQQSSVRSYGKQLDSYGYADSPSPASFESGTSGYSTSDKTRRGATPPIAPAPGPPRLQGGLQSHASKPSGAGPPAQSAEQPVFRRSLTSVSHSQASRSAKPGAASQDGGSKAALQRVNTKVSGREDGPKSSLQRVNTRVGSEDSAGNKQSLQRVNTRLVYEDPGPGNVKSFQRTNTRVARDDGPKPALLRTNTKVVKEVVADERGRRIAKNVLDTADKNKPRLLPDKTEGRNSVVRRVYK